MGSYSETLECPKGANENKAGNIKKGPDNFFIAFCTPSYLNRNLFQSNLYSV